MTILVWEWSQQRSWRPDDGTERILLEVDDDGHIHREIGVDAAGQVVYAAPALRGPYPHGTLDLQVFGAGTNPDAEARPSQPTIRPHGGVISAEN